MRVFGVHTKNLRTNQLYCYERIHKTEPTPYYAVSQNTLLPSYVYYRNQLLPVSNKIPANAEVVCKRIIFLYFFFFFILLTRDIETLLK